MKPEKNQIQLPSLSFLRGKKLVVAVSGGMDSMALLVLLVNQMPQAQRRLMVGHVNYGLRGKASDQDEQFVRTYCRTYKIQFRTLRLKQKKEAIEKKSFQDWARQYRYQWFQKIVQQEQAWGVAVAHHQNDQIETILDHLLRGAGPKGLSGIRNVLTLRLKQNGARLKIWRPLLQIKKKELEHFLQNCGILWREDHSNATNVYRRNRIRNQLLPFLKKWNPNIETVLLRMADVVSVEDEWMTQQTEQCSKNLKGHWTSHAYQCLAPNWLGMHRALQRRWIRRVIERLTQQPCGLSLDRIDEACQVWNGQLNGPRDLGHQLTVARHVNKCILTWNENYKKNC
jgi:tRNA(Ile)-lysidine synthase